MQARLVRDLLQKALAGEGCGAGGLKPQRPAARFVDAVQATVARILEEPNRFRPLQAGIRTARVPDFPYNIVFTVEESAVIILAVKQDRRDPDYWVHRLKK